ncbi:MAG: PLP-dependent aminotransferase family protein [Pyrinomonadaceae bacterium]|nr:PLP-dependent aminotransferase family protein [Pyrinomonadaceae bacterium]
MLDIPFSLDFQRKSDTPLYRQFYEAIRLAILRRQFAPGLRLPATREMAHEFNVSRNTIVLAFDQLIAEGYLEARQGSGTFVTAKIPDDFINIENDRNPRSLKSESEIALSKRGKTIVEAKSKWLMSAGVPLPLTPCVPSVPYFPFEIWAKLVAKRLKKPIPGLLNYGEIAGYGPLREAIAAYLGATRGVRCQPEQVIVVSGTQQAADLTARILLDVGDVVWTEDPGYQGTRAAFIAAGAKVAPIPVDAEGINVEAGRRKAPEAKLISVTPSHQYPLGVTMTLKRRFALLEWASKSRAWILEDDYDSEFRYESRPLAALQGLDNNNRVIYAASFSKVLSPALRIGYLVVPGDMIESFTAAKALLDRHSPVFEQTVLADFFTENHFSRHLRRMRNVYAKRRQALIAAINSEMSDLAEIAPSSAGLHLTVWLDERTNDAEICRLAKEKGISCEPLSALSIKRKMRPALILGFAPFSEKEISLAVNQIAKILRNR